MKSLHPLAYFWSLDFYSPPGPDTSSDVSTIALEILLPQCLI